MTQPSRRSEIDRRRRRHEKLLKLRQHYAMASNEAERQRIVQKYLRLNPGRTAEEFLAPIRGAESRAR